MKLIHRSQLSALFLAALFMLMCGCTNSQPNKPSATDAVSKERSATLEEKENVSGQDVSQQSTSTGNATTSVPSEKSDHAQTKATASEKLSSALIAVTFPQPCGKIQVNKANKTISVQVGASVNLEGKRPAWKLAPGYQAKITNEGGTDLNADMVYTMTNGKSTEKWKVTTTENYQNVSPASEAGFMSVFSENVVLQRQKPIRIWGTCKGASVVTVELGGQKRRSPVVGEKWTVEFSPMQASASPKTITLNAGGRICKIEKAYVGDVWLCSGQSNMELPVEQLSSVAKSAYQKIAGNTKIRCLLVSKCNSSRTRTEFLTPSSWSLPTNEYIQKFSAYAYAFGDRLEKELNIPIGLIDASYGGTIIEHWLSSYALANAGTSYGESMYNSMIYPMTGMSVKGILWYQGESNVMRDTSYEKLFAEYAKLYRSLFRDENLPIVTTQLPRYFGTGEYPKWPEFRLRQWKIAQSDPHVYMTCGIDLGERTNLHANDKLPFATRAAELTLHYIYGKNTPGNSPYPVETKRSGDRVIITFSDAESGLEIEDEVITGLVIVDSNGKSKLAKAKVIGKNQLEVWADGVSNPKILEYCYTQMPNGNLYVKNGLPAAPFRVIV